MYLSKQLLHTLSSDNSGHYATHSLVPGFQNGALAFASAHVMHVFEASVAGVSSGHERTHSPTFGSQNALAVPYYISQLTQVASPSDIEVHTGVSVGQGAAHLFNSLSQIGVSCGHEVHLLSVEFQYGLAE